MKFLKRWGIVPQYTMPGTLNENDVAARRNRMLKEMAQVMISYSTLPIFLVG